MKLKHDKVKTVLSYIKTKCFDIIKINQESKNEMFWLFPFKNICQNWHFLAKHLDFDKPNSIFTEELFHWALIKNWLTHRFQKIAVTSELLQCIRSVVKGVSSQPSAI